MWVSYVILSLRSFSKIKKKPKNLKRLNFNILFNHQNYYNFTDILNWDILYSFFVHLQNLVCIFYWHHVSICTPHIVRPPHSGETKLYGKALASTPCHLSGTSTCRQTMQTLYSIITDLDQEILRAQFIQQKLSNVRPVLFIVLHNGNKNGCH